MALALALAPAIKIKSAKANAIYYISILLHTKLLSLIASNTIGSATHKFFAHLIES